MKRCAVLIQTLPTPDSMALIGKCRELFEEVQELKNADDIALVLDGKPLELVVVDLLDLGDLRSICLRLQQEQPGTKVVTLTDCYLGTKHFYAMNRAGAHGICLKSSSSAVLSEAISRVLAGEHYCDPELDALINQGMKPGIEEFKLSKDDVQVLIRLDMRNKEIAEELDKPLATIERYVAHIQQRMNAPTRTHAGLIATRLGYVLLPKLNKDLFK